MAEGSVEVDKYHNEDPASHAQRSPEQSTAQAAHAVEEHVEMMTKLAAYYAPNGQYEDAAYVLGSPLHAMQDLPYRDFNKIVDDRTGSLLVWLVAVARGCPLPAPMRLIRLIMNGLNDIKPGWMNGNEWRAIPGSSRVLQSFEEFVLSDPWGRGGAAEDEGQRRIVRLQYARRSANAVTWWWRRRKGISTVEYGIPSGAGRRRFRPEPALRVVRGIP